MTKAQVHDQVRQLPKEEQLELLQEVWNDVASELDFALTPELVDLLERRRAASEADPGGGAPWDEVHARIRSKKHSRSGSHHQSENSTHTGR